MDKYVTFRNINNEFFTDVEECYKKYFDIDIKKQRFTGEFESSWENFLKSNFKMDYEVDDIVGLIAELNALCYDLLSEKEGFSKIIRTEEKRIETMKNLDIKIDNVLEKLKNVPYNYSLYKSDIYMQRLLTEQLKSAKESSKWDLRILEEEKAFINEDNGTYYQVPFERELKNFCEGFYNVIIQSKYMPLIRVIKLDINDENSSKDLYGEKIVFNEECQAEIVLLQGERYKIFSKTKVDEIKNYMQKLEDKIYFEEVIHSVFVNDVIQYITNANSELRIENYLYYVDKVCDNEMIVAQKTMGEYLIWLLANKDKLRVLGIFDKAKLVLDVWLDSIEKINAGYKLLLSGFIYLSEKNSCDIFRIRDMAEIGYNEYISPWAEKILRRQCKDTYEEDNEYDYKVSKKLIFDHSKPSWQYVLLQKYLIYRKMPMIMKARRTRGWRGMVYFFASIGRLLSEHNVPNKLHEEKDSLIEICERIESTGMKLELEIEELEQMILDEMKKTAEEFAADKLYEWYDEYLLFNVFMSGIF